MYQNTPITFSPPKPKRSLQETLYSTDVDLEKVLESKRDDFITPATPSRASDDMSANGRECTSPFQEVVASPSPKVPLPVSPAVASGKNPDDDYLLSNADDCSVSEVMKSFEAPAVEKASPEKCNEKDEQERAKSRWFASTPGKKMLTKMKGMVKSKKRAVESNDHFDADAMPTGSSRGGPVPTVYQKRIPWMVLFCVVFRIAVSSSHTMLLNMLPQSSSTTNFR